MTNERPHISENARYNLVQAARLLGIARSSLYKYINDGLVRVNIRKINKMPYITGREIIRIWEEQF